MWYFTVLANSPRPLGIRAKRRIKMIQIAIDNLCAALGSAPQASDSFVEKAEILHDFAIKVSEEVLRRAGIDKVKNEDLWENNQLVVQAGIPDSGAPPDALFSLYLQGVPSTLTGTYDSFSLAHDLVCCDDRVLLWKNGDNGKFTKIFTYEEAARFLIFWLAEKILQIIRKNEWDRMKEMPDLFDRLMKFAE
jgi:hypothetical protein